MNKYFRFTSVVLSIVLCFTAMTFAQETTGNIEGTITDVNGAVIPGATVEITSSSFKRTIVANDEGFFRALLLPTGIYTINATADSFEPNSKDNVQVILGNTTPVTIKLAVAGTEVQVVVDAADLPIDPTSSRIQTNLTEKELEQLPKGTNFTSALKAVPSVRNEPSAAGFSIDGATGVENSFILDGQEVSNFRTGGLNSNNNLPFQLIKELQVKNSGFEAEFGGATGGVINVVTKSGGNDFHGDFGAEFNPTKLNSSPRPLLRANPNQLQYISQTKDSGLGFFPSASLSGPIVKDRLWFFASATPQYRDFERTYTFPDGTSGRWTRNEQDDYYFARLDAAITDEFRIYSTYTYNPSKVNGLLPPFNTLVATSTANASRSVNEEALRNLGGRNAATNFNINGSYVAGSNVVISARYSRGYLNQGFEYDTNNGSYGVPNVTRFQCVTSGLPFGGNCDSGFNNVTSNDRIIKDISIRNNFEADASVIVDDFGGRHQFKFGYQRFGIYNDVLSGYTEPGRVLFYFGRTTAAADGTIFGNRDLNNDGTPDEVGYARLVEIGEFGEASSKNEAIYVQDSWQPLSNLTINAGIRFEREGVPSFTPNFDGITFGFGDKIAPRLGFAYDVLGNGKFKIFANYGQFFDRFKYELPRGSFGGNIFDDFRAPILAANPDIFSYTKTYVRANSLVYTNFRVPSNDPADFRVDPDLKPVRQTEYTAGLAIDLGASTVLNARYTHKQIDETIEDIGYHTSNAEGAGSEAYFIGNPGSGICAEAACGRYPVGAPAAKPERDYDALEISVDKRFASNFTVNANYTLSRLYGNYSGLASTEEFSINGRARDSPNVNRYFDTVFGSFNVGGAPNNGRLPTDRPHSFKFFGAYEFNSSDDSIIRLPQNNELEVSTFFTALSGTPVTTRVDLVFDAYITLNGRGDLGRTETFTETDLGLTYRYRFGRDSRYAVQFNVDVLNLFNESNVLGRYELISDGIFFPGDFADLGIVITPSADDASGFREFDRAFFDGRVTADAIKTLINSCVDTDPATAGAQCDGFVQDARFNQPQTFQGPRFVRFGFKFSF